MTRPFQFDIGEYYHLYNRGFEKSKIFRDRRDKDRFIKLLFLCNSINAVVVRLLPKEFNFGNAEFEKMRGVPIVHIIAYCLMGNHVHLLIQEIQKNGISLFMQKIATAYTMYFNTKYERSGSLFQGTFKARHLDSDVYLKYAFSYIHLNPVEHLDPEWKEKGVRNIKQVQSYLKSYHYFSLPDYTDEVRPETIILEKKAFPRYFLTKADLHEEMDNWLMFSAYDKV